METQQKKEVTGRISAITEVKQYKKGAGFRLALANMQEEVGFWCPSLGRAQELAAQLKVGDNVTFLCVRNEESGYLNGSGLMQADPNAPKTDVQVTIAGQPRTDNPDPEPKPVNVLDYEADVMAKAQVLAACVRHVRLLCDADERSQAETRGKLPEKERDLLKYVILGPEQIQPLVSTLFIEVCKEMRIQRKIREKWGD